MDGIKHCSEHTFTVYSQSAVIASSLTNLKELLDKIYLGCICTETTQIEDVTAQVIPTFSSLKTHILQINLSLDMKAAHFDEQVLNWQLISKYQPFLKYNGTR